MPYFGADAPERAASVAALAASSADEEDDEGAVEPEGAMVGSDAGDAGAVAGGVTTAGGGVTTTGASSFLPQALRAAAATMAAIKTDLFIWISLKVWNEQKF